jgi:molybdopterin synthase sulfur carrier subunit
VSIRILYFAGLKESLGRGVDTVDLPEGVKTVGDLRDWLVANGAPVLASTRNLRCAVNQEMAPASTPIKAGDEVAFFPPVTGG